MASPSFPLPSSMRGSFSAAMFSAADARDEQTDRTGPNQRDGGGLRDGDEAARHGGVGRDRQEADDVGAPELNGRRGLEEGGWIDAEIRKAEGSDGDPDIGPEGQRRPEQVHI